MIRVKREVIAQDEIDHAKLEVTVLDAPEDERYVSLSGNTVYLSWADLRTFAHALIELADTEDPQPFAEQPDAHD